ncbi:uncharacterized protein LOC110983719 isoform X2 [Acanthaster planci]|uniref:Uncharacterized protein LOC110983719 isoform X2 n=1 Tax=Acanthaster planci TaxID=133434 RepID=A0A8B7Z1P6_ACAPL|nr:uncharacterized protein LOC110983719 isoform X2 [Acanthaster planci]
MDRAVTYIANCVGYLLRVFVVWVAVVTLYIQINALPTQIPPAVMYGMTQVRTIDDLLQMLDQPVKPVIPGQGKNSAWDLEVTQGQGVIADDDDEDRDEHDGDDSDEDSGSERQKPVPAVLTGYQSHPKTMLTPLQFSLADSSRRPVQEISRVDSPQSSLGLQISDVEPLPSCIPREAVIQVLPETSKPHVMFWPGCVTVKRCGGCCNSDLHECQPTRSETVQVKVVQMEYTPRARRYFQFDGIVIRNITNHTDCSCQCKIKPQDCNPVTQVHNNCQCQCKKLVSCPARKLWDPVRCQCVCITSQQDRCLKRQEWDDNSCSCTCRKDLEASCRPPHWFNRRRCKCQRRST